MPAKETILVTGATGFVGCWLVETLYQDGADVRAGIRSWSSAARLGRFPVNIVLCDIMKKDQIRVAMEGVTHVVHCAIGERDVVVDGTRNMLEIAHELGVERFVHVSTTEVYGNATGEIDEQHPYEYTDNEYGAAKIDAEKLCWEYVEKGLPLTMVRPPIVYGPYSEYWTLRMAEKLQSGNWMQYEGHGDGLCNLIYITDLLYGIMLAMRSEHAVGEVFNLNGPEIPTWNEYFERFNAALGLPPLKKADAGGTRLRATIMTPIRASAKFAVKRFEKPLMSIYQRNREARHLMQFFEKKLKTTATLSDLTLYNRRLHYKIDKAQELLGYEPRYTVAMGLDMSIRWLRYLNQITADYWD